MRQQLFGGSGRQGCSARQRLLRWAVVTTVGGILLGLAVSCTSPGVTASAAASAAPSEASAAAGSAAPASAAASAAASAPAGSAGSGSAGSAASGGKSLGGKTPVEVAAGIQAADRDVIRTATVTLQIPVQSTGNTAVAKAADAVSEQSAVTQASVRVRSLVASGSGFVGSSDGGGTTVSITLRVPVSGYNSVMDALASIGTITDRKEDTQDVTGQMLDVTSRMKTMAESIDQVRILLTKATQISDIIAVESQLSSREADLESLKSQQAGLADQTSLSTITVVLVGALVGVAPAVPLPPPAPAASRTGFFGGLANGWEAFRNIGHVVLTVIGTLIPFVPVVIVIAIAVLIWRCRRSRPAVPVPTVTVGDPHLAD